MSPVDGNPREPVSFRVKKPDIGYRVGGDQLDPQLAQPLLCFCGKSAKHEATCRFRSSTVRPETLTTQMVDQLRDAIRCARIDRRAPALSRRLSEQLAISNTVVRVYDCC